MNESVWISWLYKINLDIDVLVSQEISLEIFTIATILLYI